MRRHLLALIGVGLLVLAGCGDDGSTATTTTTDAPTDVTQDSPETTTITTVPAAEGVAVELTVRGGALEGDPPRVAIPIGERGVITVDTDTDGEVHLHGYDVFATGGPGSPAVIEFDASIPGIFEVELEGSHVLLAEIEVS